MIPWQIFAAAGILYLPSECIPVGLRALYTGRLNIRVQIPTIQLNAMPTYKKYIPNNVCYPFVLFRNLAVLGCSKVRTPGITWRLPPLHLRAPLRKSQTWIKSHSLKEHSIWTRTVSCSRTSREIFLLLLMTISLELSVNPAVSALTKPD